MPDSTASPGFTLTDSITPSVGEETALSIFMDSMILTLGSRLINFQSQKMTVAARATADRKTFGHLS